MPRKKPYSSKQKKKQLQDKRRRKQEEGPHYGRAESLRPDSVDEEREGSLELVPGSEEHVTKGSQLPEHQTDRKLDPSRYRLQFFKESKHELEQRKREARKPYQVLPEEALEMEFCSGEDDVIDIPKRPPWNYSLSKQELQNNEEKYFRGYVDSLFSKYSPQDLSYFEMNLETWRQLWRVLEMSDIFLLITDIRYPSLGFPPALYNYITNKLKKSVILVLNKADLAPPSLVVAWQHFFKEKFPLVSVVCFTSFPKDKRELAARDGRKGIQKKRKRGTYRALGPKELYEACTALVKAQVDLSSWEAKIEEDQDVNYHDNTSEEELEEINMHDLDCSYQEETEFKKGVLTIGCIGTITFINLIVSGYPNVGKSSVMNGLMGKKVVSVSQTPGHTKHFQTIFLTPTVRLCDSPGLVFPSKVDKNLQIIAGIYPTSQVREPYSAVGYIAQRLDIPGLLKLTHPESEDGQDVKWSAWDICYAYAEKRGFLTAKAARADTYRAANQLLRMTVTGQLCLCFTPKGYMKNKDYWESHPETQEFIDLQIKYRIKPDPAAGESETEESTSDGESEQGSELSDDEEDKGTKLSKTSNEKSPSFTTNNPFALLGNE